MPAYLIEPTDVLFFRDGIPMSAGQGRGSGCRLPFPSTLHEALRASLFAKHGRKDEESAFRPKDAPRQGGWLGKGKSVTTTGSKEYQSLGVTGPLPWHKDHGLLLPVPLDAAFSKDETQLYRLALLPRGETATAGAFISACLPVATTPPDKHGQLQGWWTVGKYQRYLNGETNARDDSFKPVPTDALWQAEHRIGLGIDPARAAAAEGQLFAGTYLRMDNDARLCFQAELRDQKTALHGEGSALASLDWMLLGGERRLSRLWPQKDDLFATLRTALPPPAADGLVLLKWILITPAIFAHGSLPGWCSHPTDKPDGLPIGRVRLGASKRKTSSLHQALPGKAALVSWCLGRPQSVTGWDLLKGEAKPTQLSVPAGSVYYFLCENSATAAALAQKLHWQPRSDHYGEKGCGYGLCSFDVTLHPTSPDLRLLANTLFQA